MHLIEVPGDQYSHLFLVNQFPSSFMVNQMVWEQTVSRLPKDYFIPDYRIINMMMNMK
ncbi:hypothetical protein MKY82_23030 [Paenibacillus sp. FSL W7-1279]|uniref:hypothetical protein n=1 Tax=Paenibacillus TaxID=44249 RepID=UPI001889D8E2|nr:MULTISPECIES: hypothetical protein [Paenibacillus]MBX4147350.1 hypothetical protein [Paenibacillus lautus]